MGYILVADSHTYACRTWDDLEARLVWAREQGYLTAKARRANALGGSAAAAVGAGAFGRGATRIALG